MMDLQAALGGPPGGAPPEITVPADEGAGLGPPPEEGGSSIDLLDDAEDALTQFIQVDPDEVDRAKATKALQIVLDLKASNQTDQQQGGMKSLQRALAGAPGGAPPGGAPAGPPAGGPLGY